MKIYMFSFVVLILFFCFNRNIHSQNSILWGSLEKGNYNVGFKTIEKYDTTRFIDSSKSFRPIQIAIWYPAEIKEQNKQLLYKDYISLTAHEINFKDSSAENKSDAVLEYSNFVTSNGISNESVDLLLSAKTAAYENAETAQGSFPFVIIAQGNFNSAANLSVLSAFLASHGYFVATCSSPTRITGPIPDSTKIYQYALDQRNDMKFIYDEIKKYKNINTEKTAVIGYSFGGRGSFLMMNDFDVVKAYISLDGGFANKIGAHWIEGVNINVEKITAPILHIYEEDEPFVVVPDFKLVNSLINSERYFIKLENMSHIFFSNFGMIAGVIPGFDIPGVDKENAKLKFETVNKITLGFLNTFIKNEADNFWKEIISEPKNLLNSSTVKILIKGETK